MGLFDVRLRLDPCRHDSRQDQDTEEATKAMVPLLLGADRMRDRRLRSLVQDAHARVSSFRERLERHGLKPRDIRSIADLARLPILTRSDLLSVPLSDRLRAGTIPNRCLRARTSGTSGSPLIVHMRPFEAFYRRALLFRAFAKHARLSFPFTVSAVGVNAVKLAANTAKPSQLLGLSRVAPISRHLPLDEQAQLLLDSTPHVISGPPSCLELVAQVIQDMPRPSGFRPRLIAPRGEVLHDATRALLRKVFQCKVADFYSCEEIGNIAWECPSRTGVYHIQQSACWLETVDVNGVSVQPGAPGDVVLTNLFNRTMPFIRYRLGDRAALLPDSDARCACGHKGASLTLLDGRADDFLVLPSGERVSPRTAVGLVCSAAQHECDPTAYYMQRFQVHQTAPDRVTIRIVPGRGAPEDLPTRIADAFFRFSPDWRVDVEVTESIESAASGKLPTISSQIDAPLRAPDA